MCRYWYDCVLDLWLARTVPPRTTIELTVPQPSVAVRCGVTSTENFGVRPIDFGLTRDLIARNLRSNFDPHFSVRQVFVEGITYGIREIPALSISVRIGIVCASGPAKHLDLLRLEHRVSPVHG